MSLAASIYIYSRLRKFLIMVHNSQNSENSKTRISRIANDVLHIACDFLMAIIRIIIRALLWLARKIWKRYFNIETPLYKLWWEAHTKNMQKKLDKCHQINY